MRAPGLKLHRVVGLTIGIPLLAIGVSGTLLALHDGIGPEPAAETVVTTPEAVSRSVAAVAATRSGARFLKVTLPSERGTPVAITVADSGAARTTLLVDPDTGEIAELHRTDWIDVVRELHTALLIDRFSAGIRGDRVAGGVAALGAALVLVGLGLWWSRHRKSFARFSVYRGVNWKRSVWDIHSFVGFAAATPLFVLFLTGAIFSFAGVGAPELSDEHHSTRHAEPHETHDPERHISVASWIAAGEAAPPGGRLTEILWPDASADAVRIRKRFDGDPFKSGQSFVAIDPVAGTVLRVVDVRDPAAQSARVDRWLKLVHSGRIGGSSGELLVLLSGILPVVLLGSGAVIWLNRRKAGRRLRDALRALGGSSPATHQPGAFASTERLAAISDQATNAASEDPATAPAAKLGSSIRGR
jgi:uncharacterized iron-regulated membrane protein